MKKVRLDREEGCIKDLKTNDDLYCPITSKETPECGPWCAWFNIGAEEAMRPLKDNPKHSEFTTIKTITCKGISIAELVEKEK